jgi:hypothetical protein
MAERDDAPLADEPQPGAAPNDMPTGLPNQDHEHAPLGPEEDEPAPKGAPAMPGIPEEGEADTAG